MPSKQTTAKASSRSSPRTASRRKAAAGTAEPPLGAAAISRQLVGAVALRLLAKSSWETLQLRRLARAAKVPLEDLLMLCPSKIELVPLILSELTRTTLHVPEAGASAHDQLFDVAMSWFEALTPHKQAVTALHAGLRRDPLLLVSAGRSFVTVAGWLLSLTGADQGGQLGARRLAFALALLRALPVWLEDDADLGRTMARLDSDLRRADALLGRLGGR